MRPNIYMQVASACFLFILMFYFFRSERLRTRANKTYGLLLIACAINLFFDIFTVITLTYIDVVPPIINNLGHICFFISVDLMAYLIYRYMVIIIYDKDVICMWKSVVAVLPFLVCSAMAIFFPIKYYNDGAYIYSSGWGASAIYGSIIIYLMTTLYYNLKYWKRINPKKRRAVIQAIVIISAGGIIQHTFPMFLLSGTGFVLIVYCIYVALENPAEFIDQDTGAKNNYAFKTTLREKFVTGKNFSVLTVVFDDWNEINSRLGHHFGSKVITEFTRIIKQEYNMEVFYPATGCPALILERLAATSMAKQIDKKLEHIGNVAGMDIKMDYHICLADYPNHGKSIADVERNINFFASHPFEDDTEHRILMYTQKWQDMLNREQTIEHILANALENDGIEMNYQPIYSTYEQNFHSLEALVRLKDKETIGFISPEEFIPIAEKKGMIIDLSIMIFHKVCKFIHDANLEKLGVRYVEMNLSAIHCMDARMATQLWEIMDKYHVKPEFLNLEITETASLYVDNTVSSNLNQLIQMGCGFSMDDYGTGYSNLIQIADLTFDIAKIDKSLVWGYFEEGATKEKVILSSTVDMFKRLNMELVAEGVETEEQATQLAVMGVEYLQGYYYSRPIPESVLIEFLKEKNSVA